MTRAAARLCLPLLLLAASCDEVTTDLIDKPQRPEVRDAAPGDSGPSRPPPAHCGPDGCECNDGRDQDGDGLIDGLDPECTGPFDDDESSFGTGMPGSALDFCLDCYWDDDTDPANDGCTYHTDCLFGEMPSGESASACSTCTVGAVCRDSCLPRTQSGCDCFGCCEVTEPNGTMHHVLLTPECSVRDVRDEAKCPRCTQNPACLNPCSPCELCLGRKPRDLPMMCRGPGVMPGEEPVNVCDEGQQVCSDREPCPEEFYCRQGCCIFVVQ